MAEAMLLGNTKGDAVEGMVNILNTMSWEQRFWASWQALVEMEGRYEQILARTGSLQPTDLKKKTQMKPRAIASHMIALRRRADEYAA
jgi:hypothetical protein